MIKLIAFGIFLISAFSSFADVRPIGFRDGSLALFVNGVVTPKDPYMFLELMQIARKSNQVVRTVYLDSPGGSVSAGFEIAQIVRSSGLQSFVPNNATCASACFMIFMAGTPRFHGGLVKIGVHSASNGARQESQDALSATVAMSRYLKELGTPTGIIGRLVTSKPSEMAWLSDTELKDVAMVVLSNPDKQANTQIVTVQQSARTEVSRSEKLQARDLNAEAISSLRSSKYASAIPLLKKAAQLSPYDAEIQGNLGFALFLNGDLKNARDTLALALNIKKNRGSTWVNLGQTVSALGDLEWATECFINYLRFSSNKTAAFDQLKYFRDSEGGTIGTAAARALDSI